MTRMGRGGATAAMLVLAALLMGARLPVAWGQESATSANQVIDALRAGRSADALRMCGELLRADPQSYKLWTLRAMALDQAHQSKEALASYQHALRLAPDYLPALQGAAQSYYREQSAEAIPLLRRILAAQPSNSTAHAMLAALEYHKGDFRSAAEDFGAAQPVLGFQPAALMEYAICLAHLNRLPEAIATFQRVLELRPADGAARYDLALVQWHAQAGSDALGTLQPLLDAGAGDARALRLAAAIHEANNETPQAVELLRKAIASDPNDVTNYVEFANLSSRHGSYKVGIDIVDLGLKQLPNSASLYMARGVLFGQNSEFDKAINDFERARQLDPLHTMAATAEGIAQSQRQHHEAALTDFRREVKEHPDDAYGYYLLAEALSWSPPDANPADTQKATGEAIDAAKKATELNPHLVQAYDLLGPLYLQTDQREQAIKACRSALAMDAKDQQATYTLILALRKSGDRQELNALVKRLTELRKAEGDQNTRQFRYGQLIEGQGN